MAGEDLLVIVGSGLAGGGLGTGIMAALGLRWFTSRLQKVDQIDRKLDRFIQYQRIKDPDFRKFWSDNGGDGGE